LKTNKKPIKKKVVTSTALLALCLGSIIVIGELYSR
tara:strand:+ start:252 stop:359 length:108 start_codon:yes stop_codon:yes gene_type:complete